MNFGYFIEFNKTKITKLNLVDPNVKVFKTNKFIFIIDGYIKDQNDNIPNLSKIFKQITSYYKIKSFLKNYRGAYSLICYSSDNNQIFIGRDYDGSKQIYYNSEKDKLVISNHPKNLFGNNCEINNKICEKYLTYRYNYTYGEEETFIKNIKNVESATIISFKNFKKINSELYLNLPLSKTGKKKYNYLYYKNEIPLILKKNFLRDKNRYRNTIIGLSGGLDSTSVAAVLGNSGIRLDAYTAFYNTKNKTNLNESNKAETVAKKFCKRWYKIKITSDEFLNYWKKCYKIFDFPVCTSSFLGYLILYNKVGKLGYKKTINAGNSDLFFYGNYPCYLYNLLDLYFKDKKTFSKELKFWIKNHSTKQFPKNLTTFLNFKKIVNYKNYKKFKSIKPNQEMLKSIYLKKKKNTKIYTFKYKNDFIGATYLEAYAKFAIWMVEKQPNILPFDEIEKFTKVISLDPYLSEQLKVYFYNMPDSFKIQNGVGKKILRDSFEKLLPNQITKNYDKTGFNVPLLIWLYENKKFEKFVINQLLKFEKNIIQKNFVFNYTYNIKKIINDIKLKKLRSTNIDMIIWQITNLQMWYDENF